ncbi:MAG: hypothetical protein WEB67_09755 [Acidimicrobiia bacterium]
MGNKKAKKKRRLSPVSLWRLALAIIGIVAVAQELAKPAEERMWHGKVADCVPYDFRMPTAERFKNAYWNPDGPLLSSKAWGVGWAFNFGGLKKMAGN